MEIAGVDLRQYNAMVMDDYNVSSANVTSNVNMNSTSTTPIGYGIHIGLREIAIPIAFVVPGKNTANAIASKSRLASSLCDGRVEIYDDDNGIWYSAVFTGISDESIMMPGVYTATFQFSGIMHGDKITLQPDGSFIPEGYTEDGEDCRISVTVHTLESDGSYKVAGVTFQSGSIGSGTEIVLDGFNKIVYLNGANGMQYCDLVSFPQLYPGVPNSIECKDQVTVEYYPVYK